MAAGLLAALPLLAPSPAVAGAWASCNAQDLTPPVPIDRPPPAFPESARLAGAEGFVEVAWIVLRDGRAGWVRIVRAEPSGFFEAAALEGIRRWRFEPARRDGEPLECRSQTRLRFTLTDTIVARPAGAAPAGGDQPAPVYPEASRAAGVEGYAEVTFEVGADGRVTSAEVTMAMPRGEFEAAALAAVRQWRFAASAEVRRSFSRRFAFALPGEVARAPDPVLLAAAPLPPEACTHRIAGRVRLEVTTDAEGRVTGARILDASPARLFDATALAIARNSRIAPAYRAGHPIAATALLTLRFDPEAANCPDDAAGRDGAGSRRAPAPRVSAIAVRCPLRVAATAMPRLP